MWGRMQPEQTQGPDDLIEFTKSTAVEHLLAHGNIIEPIIIYRKDGVIHEPILVCLPDSVLEQGAVVNLVAEAYTEFIYSMAPDDATIVRQGFYMADGSGRSCLSLIYSSLAHDRTFLTPVLGREIGEWQEVEVRSGDLYGVFERTLHRRN